MRAYFCSPNGSGDYLTPATPGNFGTLVTGLPTADVEPGSILELAAGTYVGPFKITLAGTADARITVRPMPGVALMSGVKFVGVDPTNASNDYAWKYPDGEFSIIHHLSGGYTDYIGLEIYHPYTGRPEELQFQDKRRMDGFSFKAPGCRAAACYLHDLGIALGAEANSGPAEYVECICHNVGWQDLNGYDPRTLLKPGEPDKANDWRSEADPRESCKTRSYVLENPRICTRGFKDIHEVQNGTGHDFYGQGLGPTTLQRNVFCAGLGYGVHAYGNEADVKNIIIYNNIALYKGIYAEQVPETGPNVTEVYKPQFFVGSGNGTDGILIGRNVSYLPFPQDQGAAFQVAHLATDNKQLTMTRNLIFGGKNGVLFNTHRNVKFTQNMIYCSQRGITIETRIDNAEFKNNTYYGSAANFFRRKINGVVTALKFDWLTKCSDPTFEANNPTICLPNVDWVRACDSQQYRMDNPGVCTPQWKQYLGESGSTHSPNGVPPLQSGFVRFVYVQNWFLYWVWNPAGAADKRETIVPIPPGSPYDVRMVWDLHTSVANGTIDGNGILFPLTTNRTITAPIGMVGTKTATPQFSVFLVMSSPTDNAIKHAEAVLGPEWQANELQFSNDFGLPLKVATQPRPAQ